MEIGDVNKLNKSRGAPTNDPKNGCEKCTKIRDDLRFKKSKQSNTSKTCFSSLSHLQGGGVGG